MRIYLTYLYIKFNLFYFSKYETLSHLEILKYQNDPWWQNLRRGLLISFWAMICVMMVAACCIAVLAHGQVCPKNLPGTQFVDLLATVDNSFSNLSLKTFLPHRNWATQKCSSKSSRHIECNIRICAKKRHLILIIIINIYINFLSLWIIY